jgi:hypothetical protein
MHLQMSMPSGNLREIVAFGTLRPVPQGRVPNEGRPDEHVARSGDEMTDEPRIWKVRVFADHLPFPGIGILVKCPTRPNSGAADDGVRAMSLFLAEQVAAGVIRRYQVGLANIAKLNRVDPLWRSRLVRFPEAWAQIVERIAA